MTNKTRKIIPPRETIEFEVGTITLMPVRFEFFDSMTEIVNKYFSSFAEASNHYAVLRQEILDKYEDKDKRTEALLALDQTFDSGIAIAKGIMQTSANAADDARLIIEASIDPKADNSIQLEELTAVEIMILLGAAIQLNINFFNSHQDMMGLKTLFNQEKTEAKPKTGEKLPAG